MPNSKDGTNAIPLRGHATGATIVTTLLVAAFCISGAADSAESGASDRALCFLDGAEMEDDDDITRGVDLEVVCAHADRRVLDLDDETTDLRLMDGERDLLAAGEKWLEERKQSGASVGFTSTPRNAVYARNPGNERYLELTAHSNALPTGPVVRLVGTAGLVVEADCLGADATPPVTVTATAAALRSGAEIPFAQGHGGILRATEHGTSGDAPMLALAGAGTYLSLADPPMGVRDEVFFGKQRLVVDPSVADETEIAIQVCPTERIEVPVEIEVAATLSTD